MNELALFAGAGGGILGGKLLGWRTVCAVERGAYAAQVLAQRQNDGILEPFPIWSDVQTFDGKPWRGIVDVISGGFPCQDISVAGKGAGITGKRSGMWSHMARIIGEVRPRFAFVENSPALITRGLGVVLGDLAALGYDCSWTVLGAYDVGAPHQRDRFWLVASDPLHSGYRQPIQQIGELRRSAETNSGGNGQIQPIANSYSMRELQRQRVECNKRGRPCNSGEEMGHPGCQRLQESRKEPNGTNWEQIWRSIASTSWWATEPDVGRVANGVAFRVDRLKAIGNGQVPQCAATAFRMLTNAD